MNPCTDPNATHYAGCACHEARRDAEINRLKCELTQAQETITDLRCDVVTWKTRVRVDRQMDVGHAMYLGCSRDRLESLERAARAVIDRWDTPLWKDAPATAGFINELRKALEP